MSSDASEPLPTWKQRFTTTEASAAKAIQKEREGDLSTAYALCIETAQSYLWLIRKTDDPHAKETLKAASTKILARAEKIKAVKRDVRPAHISCFDERKLNLMFPNRVLSSENDTVLVEQSAVLDTSASINGQKYAPWTEGLPQEATTGAIYVYVRLSIL